MAISKQLQSNILELFRSNPHLLFSCVPKVGSEPDGNALEHVPCASNTPNDRGSPPCRRRGTLSCSKCRLVKYCSKECQITHWRSHKPVCNLYSTWKPAYLQENRTPAFSGNDAPKYLFRSRSGQVGQHLWGNTPATDVLNLTSNEGDSGSDEDYTICFAASGDIRNVIATVNGLPTNYQGHCNIILNDLSPFVTIRNLIILTILFGPERPADEAAELALHISYSAMLTADQTLYLYQWAAKLRSKEDEKTSPELSTSTSSFRHTIPRDTLDYALELISSRYTADVARENMEDVVLSPYLQDHCDRRWICFRPGQRLADMQYRREAVLLPFGAPHDHFCEPNRLMFSEDGEWLSQEWASPLEGWDLRDVIKSGAQKTATSEDLFGCLFFHVKDRFAEFYRRVQTLRINIFQFSMAAEKLCKVIAENPDNYLPSSLLDRVDTSNLMDYIGLPRIISDWSPLLNRGNPKSTLLAYTLNWAGSQPGAQTETAGPGAMLKAVNEATRYFGTGNPLLFLDDSVEGVRLRMNTSAFHEIGPLFERYLKTMGIAEVARKWGVRRRTRNSIRAPSPGSTLSNPGLRASDLSKDDFYWININSLWSTRFLEFEAK